MIPSMGKTTERNPDDPIFTFFDQFQASTADRHPLVSVSDLEVRLRELHGIPALDVRLRAEIRRDPNLST
jgi:hypothetical protein